MIEFNERDQEPGEEGGGGLSVAVVGIGGAGANVLDRIALEGMTEAELVCMNTDIRALTNSVAATKVQLGKNLTQGLGAGGDPDLGEDAAKSSEEDIRNAVRGKDIVFVCGGLGGGTGSGAAPFVSGIARSEGAFVVAFTTMPFSFEGRRRLSQAQNSLNQLRKTANALITFDNDRMGSLVLPKQGIQEAFAEADKIISQSVRAVIQLVTKPGLISIGMDDLITALDNDDSRCLFGYGQATGENRVQEALGKALKSPLLDKGEMLEEAQNVLVHICGGDSMTLFEVELLMKSLEKEVSDKAQILFGVGSDPKLGDKLSVTVISSMGKQLPPTADDETPKVARSESGSERKESASADAPEPEAPKSSRSEVKPDQATSIKAGAPVAVAAATLGSSLMASPASAPAAEAATAVPRARMSPIRRAMLPPDLTPAEEAEGGVPVESKPAVPGGNTPGSGSAGKGVISIFEDDDEDEADGDNLFDDSDSDLDDDLDLMGDLGLDDEELDRLVAESAAVGLDDGDEEQSDEADSGLSLMEDATLVEDDVRLAEAADEKEEPIVHVAPPVEVEPEIEPKVVEEETPFLEEAEEDVFESEKSVEPEKVEDPVDEFDTDDLDAATVVAGAAVEDDVPVVAEASSAPPEAVAAPSAGDDFLVDDDEDDDFESFDDAEELEKDDSFEEFDELEVVDDADVEEVAEEFLVEDDLAEDDLAEDDGDDDPMFGADESAPVETSRPAAAAEPPPAASVAPAQANKTDELLKRVGLRRAPGGGLPGRPGVAAERPQAEPQEATKSRFAWSKPGTVPAPAAPPPAPESEEIVADEQPAPRPTQLPPARSARPAARTPDPKADEPAAESPFTPKGFVKKKTAAGSAPPRRGLPVKPTPLKLGAAKPAPPVEAEPEQEPVDVTEPEQQTFDSTLEPSHDKGRFEKGEPTVEDGEDLDLPTFLRRKKG